MTELITLCENAVRAKYAAALICTDKKNEVLKKCAEALVQNSAYILAANDKDLETAVKNGMSESKQDRLRLTEARIEGVAEGLRQVSELPDSIGEAMDEFDRPNGLHISKVRVPMGVIGIIYESRPNVTADAFSLTFKAGSACILKGGSDAIETNKAIVKVLRDVLESAGLDPDILQLIENTDRAVTTEFMKMKQYVDVLIPRGGAGLIRAVVENSLIPVIETGTGNCHVYVDKDADLDMAVNIVFNAKTQRISVCNSMESLVVHRDIKDEFLPKLYKKLSEKNVEFRCDADSLAVLGDNAKAATEEDFGTEYLDYILSVKTVDSVEEAIDHINKYSTHHSESIVTSNDETAEKFLERVDAACVYKNVSTRFTDGFEFGFGAEIGISTQKLHARGPMGLKEITSYKYRITGNGQVRG
ncbi:MAG: glutamate-5-semialdehyde dehydrogenase [Lachnospiraceae bacterium]|nr:glutamate-5-semialdehyde dehydrogenase [Lachnospiraceae bacterium]